MANDGAGCFQTYCVCFSGGDNFDLIPADHAELVMGVIAGEKHRTHLQGGILHSVIFHAAEVKAGHGAVGWMQVELPLSAIAAAKLSLRLPDLLFQKSRKSLDRNRGVQRGI